MSIHIKLIKTINGTLIRGCCCVVSVCMAFWMSALILLPGIILYLSIVCVTKLFKCASATCALFVCEIYEWSQLCRAPTAHLLQQPFYGIDRGCDIVHAPPHLLHVYIYN